MKAKTPEVVQMFKTSGGTTVATLDDWKRAELRDLIGVATENEDGKFEENRAAIVHSLIERSDDVIAILAVKERGRPNGAKDRKPRKRATPPVDAIPKPQIPESLNLIGSK